MGSVDAFEDEMEESARLAKGLSRKWREEFGKYVLRSVEQQASREKRAALPFTDIPGDEMTEILIVEVLEHDTCDEIRTAIYDAVAISLGEIYHGTSTQSYSGHREAAEKIAAKMMGRLKA